MPAKSRPSRRPGDPNQLGKLVVDMTLTRVDAFSVSAWNHAIAELSEGGRRAELAHNRLPRGRSAQTGGPHLRHSSEATGPRFDHDKAVLLQIGTSRGSRIAAGVRKLSRRGRSQIIRRFLEGESLRAVANSTQVSYATICELFANVTSAVAELQDQAFRELKCQKILFDQVLTVDGRGENHAADYSGAQVWLWVAIDRDTKLVPSWRVGDRSPEMARAFVEDLASRLDHRVRITTDGDKVFLDAIEDVSNGELDWTVLVNAYGHPSGDREICDSADCGGGGQRHFAANTRRTRNDASRSRQDNRTISSPRDHRCSSVDPFSMNRDLPVALHYMRYNFCRVNEGLGITPAMAARVTGRVWTIDDLVQVLENWELTR
jgi:hypothetical protein